MFIACVSAIINVFENSPEKTWKEIVITENPRKNENHPEDCIPEDSVNNEGIVRELWKLAAT